MQFLVIVNDSPLGSQAALTALRFCLAAVARGHRVTHVFFNGDGVYQQLPIESIEAGTKDLHAEWRRFASAGESVLAVCPAASSRRLVGDVPGESVFKLTGLAEMLDSARRVDRVISFGGGGRG